MSKPPRFAGPEIAPPRGPGRCRWCDQEVIPPRVSWCSQKCVDAYLIRRSSADARRLVWERDHGVCACCQLDCEALQGKLRRMLKSPKERRAGVRLRTLLGVNQPYRKTFWDADHVRPVAAGGGLCGLSNLRTLCLWCHKNRTAAEADVRNGRPVAVRLTGSEFVHSIFKEFPSDPVHATPVSAGSDRNHRGGRKRRKPGPAPASGKPDR